MNEKSVWECGILSRDNMSHPLVRHIAPQGDSDFLWAEAHERSYTAKANHPAWQDVMQEPQNVAGQNAVATIYAPLYLRR